MFDMPIPPSDLYFAGGLFLSLLFGYVIGAEREMHGKAAGISTQCLVIAGSMAFCFLSGLAEPLQPSRIASNVVTGIGFLGAGIIFHHAMTKKSGDKVLNLTTSATIWMSAAIGMALGFGYPLVAFGMVVFTIIALNMPHYVPGVGRV